MDGLFDCRRLSWVVGFYYSIGLRGLGYGLAKEEWVERLDISTRV